MNKLPSIIALLGGTGKRAAKVRTLLIVSIIFPVLALIYLALKHFYDEATSAQFQIKAVQSRLAASVVEGNLNAMIAVCRSYATRPLLVKAIANRRWQQSVEYLDGLQNEIPGIERMVLYDTNAVIMADLPPAHVSVIGESRADKQWFKELRKRWQPYVSGVYLRGATPKKNIVCIVIPIWTRDKNRNGNDGVTGAGVHRKLGILQVQLMLDSFYSWTHIDIGKSGLIYLVDQYGNIVHHPYFEREDTIVDFSSVSIVKKAISGQNGVEINFNEVEKVRRLAGFRNVPNYGWGVVVTQQAGEAFKERNTTLAAWGFSCLLFVLLTIAYVVTIARIITLQHKLAKTLSDKNGELKTAMANIKTLKGLLPICAHCKKVRNDAGYWEQIETYIHDHSSADFSHGVCPACLSKYYPDIAEKVNDREKKSKTHV